MSESAQVDITCLYCKHVEVFDFDYSLGNLHDVCECSNCDKPFVVMTMMILCEKVRKLEGIK